MCRDVIEVRVAIVTESFLPSLNGVTTSVCRVLDRLADLGHEALVIAPGPAPAAYRGFHVHQVRGVTVRGFRVGMPSKDIERTLAEFRPDVVHAASPYGLGERGLVAARNLGLPTVAIYQTDMTAYLTQHAGPARERIVRASWRWLRHLHSLADITLAPSKAALDDLTAHGIPRVAMWGRGVDTVLFDPVWREHEFVRSFRECIAPEGEAIVGYVGRLAPEKHLDRLAELADLLGTAMVIVGDGPSRDKLERLMPRAHFLGYQQGEVLARSYASLDVFVHVGTTETFGQTLQEAMASGVPVVAPAAGGPLDIVKPGVTGLLFDPARDGALRESVGGLIADSAMRERMGVSARHKMESRGWAPVVDQLIGYYTDAINPAYRRRAAS